MLIIVTLRNHCCPAAIDDWRNAVMLKLYDLLRVVFFTTFAFIIGNAVAQDQTNNPDLAKPIISSVVPTSASEKSSMSAEPAGTVDLVEGDVRIYDGSG